MGGGVSSRLWWLGLGAWLVAGAGAADSDPAKEAWRATKAQVAELRQKQQERAIEACEAFLKRFPASRPYARNAAVAVNEVLSAGYDRPEQRHAVFERAVKEHAAAADYYSLGSAGLARELLARQEYAKADDLLTAAIVTLGDRLSADYYLGFNLYILRVQALRGLKKLDEADALVQESAARSPWMLGDRGSLRAVYDLAVQRQDAGRQLQAAKLFYILCDFTEPAVKEGTELVSVGLNALDGPGAAL